MSARIRILEQFRETARQQRLPLAGLQDDLPLNETGLDSLCFAIIVARLEDELGTDPFAQSADFPLTIGEFIAAYERACA